MENPVMKHPVMFTFFIVLYGIGLWGAHHLFGFMGVFYWIVVPLPIIVFSVMIQKNKGNAQKPSYMPSIWFTPVPYLALVLVGYLVFSLFSKFI